VQDGDHVGIAYLSKPVRNKNRSAILHDFAAMIQDLVFGVGVHTGKCIIKNSGSAGLRNDRTGNRSPLLLAAGSVITAFAHQRSVLVRKFSISAAMLAASAAEWTS